LTQPGARIRAHCFLHLHLLDDSAARRPRHERSAGRAIGHGHSMPGHDVLLIRFSRSARHFENRTSMSPTDDVVIDQSCSAPSRRLTKVPLELSMVGDSGKLAAS